MKLIASCPSRSRKGAKHSSYLRKAFLVLCLILAAGPMYLIYVILFCFTLFYLSQLILPYRILSYLILSYLILIYFILSYSLSSSTLFVYSNTTHHPLPTPYCPGSITRHRCPRKNSSAPPRPGLRCQVRRERQRKFFSLLLLFLCILT